MGWRWQIICIITLVTEEGWEGYFQNTEAVCGTMAKWCFMYSQQSPPSSIRCRQKKGIFYQLPNPGKHTFFWISLDPRAFFPLPVVDTWQVLGLQDPSFTLFKAPYNSSCVKSLFLVHFPFLLPVTVLSRPPTIPPGISVATICS